MSDLDAGFSWTYMYTSVRYIFDESFFGLFKHAGIHLQSQVTITSATVAVKDLLPVSV